MNRDANMTVIRGGSWGDSPEVIVRATFVSAHPPVIRYEYNGFRTRLAGRSER